MAYIKSFTKDTKQKDGKHTDVDCVYYILEVDNQTVIQFDTFGSATRQFELLQPINRTTDNKANMTFFIFYIFRFKKNSFESQPNGDNFACKDAKYF
jgi:hypothetical protein